MPIASPDLELLSPQLEREKATSTQDKPSPLVDDNSVPASPLFETTPDSPPEPRQSARTATHATIDYYAAAEYQTQKKADSTKTNYVETCFHILTDKPQTVYEVKV